MKTARSTVALACVLLLGTLLRFWNLDFKPLWMDEVITALFSFGRSYLDVPLERSLPTSAFEQVFTLNSDATCAQITSTVAVQSVHPPLFFCWMHSWLSWLDALPVSWVWKLRSLPALFGVVAIAAVYQFNRVAFSTRAGLIGAIVMAVSPFAVYLSQEARHYTLPMLLVILALLGVYHILLDRHHHQFRPLVWLGWVAVNSLGFYVHYFFVLAFAAQAVTLMIMGRQKGKSKRQKDTGTGQRDTENESAILPFPRHPFSASSYSSFSPPHPLLPIALVCLTYLPWLPTFLSHMNRSETSWIETKATGWLAVIAPLVQLLGGWIVMTVALPIEGQPLWFAVLMGCLMGVFFVWLAWRVAVGIRRLWRSSETQLACRMLLLFVGFVVVQFLAIAYLLGKDLTVAPRYNFIYFPAVCALVGAGLSQPPDHSPQIDLRSRLRSILAIGDRRAIWIILLVGCLSSFSVVSNGVFQKPYKPDHVAETMYLQPQLPLLATIAYNDFQDVALGLSFSLQLARQGQELTVPSMPHFTFMAQFSGYEAVWRSLARLPQTLPFPLNLWVISPGLKRVGYRKNLSLSSSAGIAHQCTLDPEHYYRIGIPYQLYRCR